MDLPKRRTDAPDIDEAARQVIDDMRRGDDATGFLDVVETVAALGLNENDLIALVAALADRVAHGDERSNGEQG
ncbi:MAG: hypothetical protein M3501_02700 [Actinomycetota bacterium]|nr:hypothetical protein [Actinomycetota bacterium]